MVRFLNFQRNLGKGMLPPQMHTVNFEKHGVVSSIESLEKHVRLPYIYNKV